MGVRRAGVHVLVWIVLLAAGAAGGWVARGRGAAEAEQQLAGGAAHVQAAIDDTRTLQDGLQQAQDAAADVTTDVQDAAQGIEDAVESTEEAQVVVEHVQQQERQQGDTLSELEAELEKLARYGQPLYPGDLDTARELVQDLRQQHDDQQTTIRQMNEKVTGLETSLRSTLAELTTARDRAQHLDVALSVSEQHVTEVRDQLQAAADDLKAAQDSLAAANSLSIWVGAGAAAAGLVAGLLIP